MNRKQYLLLVVLAIIAGFIGGALSGRIFTARETKGYEKVVSAEQFRLVDEKGDLIARTGTIGARTEPSLILYDKDGRVIWRASY